MQPLQTLSKGGGLNSRIYAAEEELKSSAMLRKNEIQVQVGKYHNASYTYK
jgi:hypothetical protein